jgi:predicted ATP-grasp superfamily ATP-dependent carboligase
MVNAKTGRVLVFGDDMRIFLAVVRSLGRAGLEVQAVPFNWHAPALTSRYVRKVHRLVRYSDDARAWQMAVVRLLQTERFDLVIPCCDRATLALHANRHLLAEQRLAIPGPAAMDLLFDKEQTHRMCRDLGISVVRAQRLDLSATASGLVSKFGLPLVIKPRRSVWADRLGSLEKVAILDREQDVAAFLASVAEHDRFQVEAFFAGEGVGVSVLAHEGRILQAFQHRRLREGRGGVSSYRISEAPDAELLAACAKICRHIGHSGVCMFEFRVDRSNRSWILIETNARFWGSMALPVAIGVDFPRLLYELTVEARESPPIAYPVGVRSRNFVLDGFNLLGRLRRGERRGWLSDLGDYLAQPIGWITGRERSDSFVADDPAPALWECAGLFKAAYERRKRSAGALPRRRQADRAGAELTASPQNEKARA